MEFLIILTIKSTIVILLAGAILVALKRNSATLRHWIISLTMIGLLGLPLFIEVLPTVTVEVPYLAKQTIHKSEPIADQPIINKKIVVPTFPTHTKAIRPVEVTNLIDDTPTAINNNAISGQEVVFDKPEEATPASTLSIPLPTLIGIFWLLGGAYFFIKFLLGLYHIWSITRSSYPFPIPKNLQASSLINLQQKVQFLVSPAINTPMTWGAFQPVVLLPTAALDWSVSELRAVLIHELSHIQRKDYWIHTVGLLAVCLYWYNPLIWWMKKQQLLEREKACDEAVLLAGVKQQNYAEQLLQITRCLTNRSSIIEENALPMAKVSQIKKRVVAILNFENSSYQFSTGKQWRWGAFYSCLLPVLAAISPIGQQVIQDHFPLPPLETITKYLDTKQLSTTIVTDLFPVKKLVTIRDTQTIDSLNIIANHLDVPKHNNELITPPSLQRIPTSLTGSSLPSIIPINTSSGQTGLMGQWKEGSSEFKIWTYGEIKIIDTAPYFDIISPDGIIFIEEYIDGFFGRKAHQLTLAKAPHHLLLKPDYGKELDLSTNPIVRKGELIKIWINNKGFLFFDKNMDKWIADKVRKIALTFEEKKQQNIIQKKSATDQEFNTRILQTKKFIDFLYLSEEEAIAQTKRMHKIGTLIMHPPFKQIPAPTNTNVTQILGRQKPVGKNTGNDNTSPVGNKYTTLIKGSKEVVVLKNFNFHLSENTFKNLKFELSLYNVVDGNIQYAILQKPIPITVAEGAGWVRKDLSAYNIVSKGDILVVLKSTEFSGSKRGKTLYFSLADDYEQYQPLLADGMDWDTKFWENDFIMYITALGEDTSTSALPQLPKPTNIKEQIHSRLVNLHSVSNNNENFAGYEGLKEAIGDAEIVMLGEQSHGEATTFETKIKLIKYLHQEMGFDVLAFESNLYECDRTWSMVEEGQNVKNTLGKSIFFVWSAVEELNPLYDYIEKQLRSERPLRVAGFDHQIVGKIGKDYFVADLTSYIHTFKDASVYQYQLEELQTFLALLGHKKMKRYNKKRAAASISFLQELQEHIKAKPSDEQSSFWLLTIKNLELFISDMKLGTDTRDQQMANNLVWLKERYPNKKIICWGATSHFLYNSSDIRMDKLAPQILGANYYKKHSMMGDYIKEKYGDKVYTIGFTAYEGKTKYKSLKPPPENSLEFLIGAADADNYFLPLEGLSLENYMSRPLGNYYMTTDIARVMDGVIFNRHMKAPYTDWDFFMYLVPENKYIPKKLDRLKEYQRKRRLEEGQ